MNFTQQGHIHRFIEDEERLNIHWDLLLKCQYHCSYCYARNLDYFHYEWDNKEPSLSVALPIIDAVSRSTLPYNFGLLGGEPTLHPFFPELLYWVNKKCNKNKNRIYIVSNAANHIEWFRELPYYENMSFLWSFHPEYAHDLRKFLAKVILMKEKGYGTKVNIILHPDPKYKEAIEGMYRLCKDYKIEFHPQFLYKESDKELWPYDEDFWEWAKMFDLSELKKYQFSKPTGDGLMKGRVYNDYEIFTQDINKFKEWNCYNSNWEINVEGKVRRFCDPLDPGTLLRKDKDFFKRIKKIEPMECMYKRCCCDGLLKIYKERE